MSDDSQEQVNRNSSPVVVVEDQVATSSNSSSDAADANDDKFKAFHLVVSSRRTLYIMGTTALIFVLGLTIGLSSAKSDRNTESDNHPYFNPFVAVEDYEQGGNAVILDDPYFDKILCAVWKFQDFSASQILREIKLIRKCACPYWFHAKIEKQKND